jgi:hypothetical protein
MTEKPGYDYLDGGWWPRSRLLAVELIDLVKQMPDKYGHIARVIFSPPDWDDCPARVAVGDGFVTTSSFPRDDTHLLLLKKTDLKVLRILVIPPSFTDDQAEEAMLAAATRGNSHPPSSLLNAVTDAPAADPRAFWVNEDKEPGLPPLT